MADTLNKQLKKKIGENLRLLINARVTETDLRNIDAMSGKDHSWLGKIFKGQQNMTLNSLIDLMEKFELQPKDIFSFDVNYKENTIS